MGLHWNKDRRALKFCLGKTKEWGWAPVHQIGSERRRDHVPPIDRANVYDNHDSEGLDNRLIIEGQLSTESTGIAKDRRGAMDVQSMKSSLEWVRRDLITLDQNKRDN